MTDTQAGGFEAAFQEVQALAATFQAGEAHYLSPGYQEQEARQDFLDKFWTALGWDVGHNTQTNPYAQEVKVERSVSMHEGKKRADYAFYLDPDYKNPKFFVEAKKPSVDIANKDSYFQAIRYGWNAGTPLAVLTDFEQFHVLDSRAKPDIDTALSHAVQKYHYSEYADRDKFGAIYWLFSREAVATGFLDAFAKQMPKASGKLLQRGLFHGGYQGIDESFLRELDEYRGRLARAFHAANPALDSETLTEATQRVLDRLVFIRFLEDKGIEPEPMVAHFGDKGSAWAGFLSVSRRLDTVYNGNIFKPHLIDKPGFHAPDSVFGQICSDLSSEQSPYLFSLIPIHILGSIYERFLGKVIVVDGGTALVEEKPEVRKAGGVYYTPDYIVRYIVDHTVGQQIQGRSPAEIAALRFADIACGSGSFLLGIYDCLLRFHTAYFNAKARGRTQEAKKAGCEMRDGVWHLSLWQKRQILLQNVWGVDIDAQAVEVAQMSLYLKLLEEETTATAREQNLLHGTILPTLTGNIVFGNSLIGTDILEGQLFEPTEERKLNPLDFKSAFPQIMKNGGFDAIVGNPPWGASLDSRSKTYLSSRFPQVADFESSQFFLIKGLSLIGKGKSLGLIIPNTFALNVYAYNCRQDVQTNASVRILGNLSGVSVFAKANVRSIITILDKDRTGSCEVVAFNSSSGVPQEVGTVHPSHLKSLETWTEVLAPASPVMSLAKRLLETGLSLQDYCEVKQGYIPYRTTTLTRRFGAEKAKQILQSRAWHSTDKLSHEYLPELQGADIERYFVAWSGTWVRYGDWVSTYLPLSTFSGPRVLVREITGKFPGVLRASYTDETFVHNPSVLAVLPKKDGVSLKFVLGIINSQAVGCFFLELAPKAKKGLFPKIIITDAKRIPMPRVNMSETVDKAKHDKMVNWVEQMLAAKKERANALTDRDTEYWQRRCDTLDRQIDELVYELYGLTDDEITLVEGTNAAGQKNA